jgi:hypothetical protein
MIRTIVGGLLACMLASPARAEPVKYPWAKPPGPIAGRFKLTCEGSKDMVVEFSLQGEKKAIGHVASLGEAAKYGYKQGDEILKLEADDYGDWVGQLKWRSVGGVERWDPIRLVATSEALHATMTTDTCYRNMPRVH